MGGGLRFPSAVAGAPSPPWGGLGGVGPGPSPLPSRWGGAASFLAGSLGGLASCSCSLVGLVALASCGGGVLLAWLAGTKGSPDLKKSRSLF